MRSPASGHRHDCGHHYLGGVQHGTTVLFKAEEHFIDAVPDFKGQCPVVACHSRFFSPTLQCFVHMGGKEGSDFFYLPVSRTFERPTLIFYYSIVKAFPVIF